MWVRGSMLRMQMKTMPKTASLSRIPWQTSHLDYMLRLLKIFLDPLSCCNIMAICGELVMWEHNLLREMGAASAPSKNLKRKHKTTLASPVKARRKLKDFLVFFRLYFEGPWFP